MASSDQTFNPQKLLEDFSNMCKKSIAPNGDRQEDGWGAAWLDEKDNWQTIKSLSPIWDDREKFSSVPPVKTLVAHARSATFPGEKGILGYNQPYVDGKYCFVFNGSLKGVKLEKPVPGKIGAQKIWFLLREKLKEDSVSNSLQYIKEYLEKNSAEITALNIGIATKNSLTALCKFKTNPDYYTLHYSSNKIKIICSEKLNDNSFLQIPNNKIKNL